MNTNFPSRKHAFSGKKAALWIVLALALVFLVIMVYFLAIRKHEKSTQANRIFVDNFSICIADHWLSSPDTCEWRSDTCNASLQITKLDSFSDELDGLRNSGRTIEELDGYYRCVTQEGPDNTVVYLYPAPDGESGYWLETHWSYDSADEAEVKLQAKQLRQMAESFRIETTQ